MAADHAAREEVPVGVWLSSDPALALARADMTAWADAHPCECEAICECDPPDDEDG